MKKHIIFGIKNNLINLCQIILLYFCRNNRRGFLSTVITRTPSAQLFCEAYGCDFASLRRSSQFTTLIPRYANSRELRSPEFA
jgi:hypothetical protein